MSENQEATVVEPRLVFRNDSAPDVEMSDEEATEWTRQRIRRLPPEVGAVLVGVGVVGLILPGPVGAPLILAGGLVLIPRVFGHLEGWLHKRFPKSHRIGLRYVDRFIDDYERRYPERCGSTDFAPAGAASADEPRG